MYYRPEDGKIPMLHWAAGHRLLRVCNDSILNVVEYKYIIYLLFIS